MVHFLEVKVFDFGIPYKNFTKLNNEYIYFFLKIGPLLKIELYYKYDYFEYLVLFSVVFLLRHLYTDSSYGGNLKS